MAPDAARCLWDPAERAWQQNLTNLFLPAELQDLLTVEGRDLVVYLPPVLSHMPVEALLINGRPLAARADGSAESNTSGCPRPRKPTR